MRPTKRRSVSLMPWILLILAGCGSQQGPTPEQARAPEALLKDVGEVYRLSTIQNKKPPASMKQLRNGSEFPNGYRAIESGDVIVVYGTPVANTDEEPSPTAEEGGILAYGKAVPESGGPVLMANRSIKTMTASEFQAVAPKVAPLPKAK